MIYMTAEQAEMYGAEKSETVTILTDAEMVEHLRSLARLI